MQFNELFRMSRDAANAFVDDEAQSMGAALAYYTMFSIAPLLLLVIAIAGMVFGADAARGQVVGELRGLMGEDGALAIEGLLKSASQPAQNLLATVVSILTLLIGATTVFAELQSDLDRIWKTPAAKRPSGLWGLLRARFLSLGMIVGVGFLLVVSLALSAGLSALGTWWGPYFRGWAMLLQAVNFVVSFGVITVAFAMVYKIMPSARIQWRDVWIGAVVTALLFTLGKYLIGVYIGKTGVASGFGAAGSLIVVMVWVYYSTQTFLLGAEFTQVFAHRAGSRAGAPAAAAPEENRAISVPLDSTRLRASVQPPNHPRARPDESRPGSVVPTSVAKPGRLYGRLALRLCAAVVAGWVAARVLGLPVRPPMRDVP